MKLTELMKRTEELNRIREELFCLRPNTDRGFSIENFSIHYTASKFDIIMRAALQERLPAVVLEEIAVREARELELCKLLGVEAE